MNPDQELYDKLFELSQGLGYKNILTTYPPRKRAIRSYTSDRRKNSRKVISLPTQGK